MDKDAVGGIASLAHGSLPHQGFKRSRRWLMAVQEQEEVIENLHQFLQRLVQNISDFTSLHPG